MIRARLDKVAADVESRATDLHELARDAVARAAIRRARRPDQELRRRRASVDPGSRPPRAPAGGRPAARCWPACSDATPALARWYKVRTAR